mgnify:CR=1 FL=1
MNHRITPEYWMRVAVEIAKASTCRADVGCVLIHKNVIVGVGYVGSVHSDEHCMLPDRLADSHILMKTDRQGSTSKGDTCIRTIHAEMNAVLKCTVRGSESDGWIHCYSTYQPCLDCTKVLLQIGVRKIYYVKAYKDVWRDAYLAGLRTNLKQSIEMKAVSV